MSGCGQIGVPRCPRFNRMENIYTSALRRAAKAEGSTQALAGTLRVPEGTLLRWMSGRAMMPLEAFRKIVELLTGLEQTEPPAAAPAARHVLGFSLGELSARCKHCGSADFLAHRSADALPYSAQLLCASCGTQALHKDLLSQLAQDLRFAARPRRAMRRAPAGATSRKAAEGDAAA